MEKLIKFWWKNYLELEHSMPSESLDSQVQEVIQPLRDYRTLSHTQYTQTIRCKYINQ